MDYGGGNLDTLTVSRVASTAVLGQYTRAYDLIFQPLSNYLAQALTSVLFSTLSRIQQDLGRLRRAYFSVLSLRNLMLFPICAGMAVAAQELVQVVLGPQWGLAAGLVPWFALAGGCHVVSLLTQLVADARAELNRSLVVQTAYIVVSGAALSPDGVALPLPGGVGVRGGGRSRRSAPVRGLPRSCPACPGTALGADMARARSGSVRQRGRGPGRRRHEVGVRRPRRRLFVLLAEGAAGALALALCIRWCPLPEVRSELWMRLTAADLVGGPRVGDGGWRR